MKRSLLAATVVLLLGGVAVHRLTADVNKSAEQQYDDLVDNFNKFAQLVEAALIADAPQSPEAVKKAYQEKLAAPLKQLLADAEKLAVEKEATDQHKQTALQVKLRLVQLGSQQDLEFAKEIVKANPGSDFAAMAEAQVFLQKMKAGLALKEMKTELEGFTQRYEETGYPIQLYSAAAGFLQSQDKTKEAIDVCETAIGKFADNPYVSQLRDIHVKLKMIGNPIELSGPTLAGSQFDIKALKGKVVLVDFWATWCGPCVKSMPAVVRLHKKYHEQGFEVVGVSLDDNKKELDEFVQKHEMSWPQIIFDEPEKMAWKNPLAAKFAVNAIPRMILVGRDGNVVSAEIYGEEEIEAAVQRELAKTDKPLAN